MTKRLRAVLDTNVFVSAYLSRNPRSPTLELVKRWMNNEFTLLVTEALVEEITEKLIEYRIERERVTDLIGFMIRLAEWVLVSEKSTLTHPSDDPDDDVVLACAISGKADYLVTYDPHLLDVAKKYNAFKITKALPFLWAVRGDTPPSADS